MIDTLANVIKDMEDGVNNFTIDGKCSGCGQCCSALLPLSNKEINNIRKYIKKKNIKPCRHGVGSPRNIQLDLMCPFLDESKKDKKCLIYPARPQICKAFKCDIPPSKVKKDKELFWSTRGPIYMWDMFGDQHDS